MSDNDGWNEHKELVEYQLKELNVNMKDFGKELISVKVEIEKLKIKSSMWGAIAGVVVTSLVLIVKQMFK